MTATAEQLESLEEHARSCIPKLWRAGDLAWKLDEHQLPVYEKIRAWQARVANENMLAHRVVNRENRRARGLRIFVLRIARRWGKTFLVVLIRVEDCIRRGGSVITYSTAFQKDIWDIIQPMVEDLCADAPEDVRPVFVRSMMAYRFPNGSKLRLVGIDKNPNGLRGRASDGFDVTEAGRVPKLASTIVKIIYPQFQRRPHATMILESNAPESADHDFDRVFVPSAKMRGSIHEATIDDNTAISEEERQEFVEAAREVDPYAADLEYYNKQQRNPGIMVVPEFDRARHVVPRGATPRYAHCYVGMDPGWHDFLGIVWGYFDFERNKLVIQRSFAEPNCSTPRAAEMIRDAEHELWGIDHREPADGIRRPQVVEQRHPMITLRDVVRNGAGQVWRAPETALTYWDPDAHEFRPNPRSRFSDTNAQMIGDLHVVHSLGFEGVAKPRSLLDPNEQNALRHAFGQGWIEIWEDSGPLAHQLEYGQWRMDAQGRRVDWARSPSLGHLDCIAALAYLYRNLSRHLNPFPPAVIDPVQTDMVVPEQLTPPNIVEKWLATKQFRDGTAAAGRQWR